jgi:hypothetical protein
MFSVLSNDDIAELTNSMGADIDINDFATFDSLKELEYARHDLFTKESEKKIKLPKLK